MAKRKKVSTPAIWNHLCLLKTGVGDEESFVFFLLLTFLLLIINCILLKRTKHVFHFFLFQGDKDWDFYSKGTKVYFFCSLSAKIPTINIIVWYKKINHFCLWPLVAFTRYCSHSWSRYLHSCRLSHSVVQLYIYIFLWNVYWYDIMEQREVV